MAYKQRWLQYFEVLDADGSGFVDPGDLKYSNKIFATMLGKPEDSPEVKIAADGYSSFFNNLIKAFDANKDGKVSKEELLAGVEKYFVGKQPAELPEWWRSNIAAAFNQFDPDKNGEVSLEENTAALQRISPTTSAEDLKRGYEWVAKQSPKGKFEAETYANVVMFKWATDPNDIPEITILTPYLRK